MILTRLTSENVDNYLNKQIIFKTRGVYVISRTNSIFPSKQGIVIDYPDLGNTLQLLTRRIYVLE